MLDEFLNCKKTNERIELGWFKINGGQWWDNSEWNGSICIILFEQISSKSASFRWKCHQLTNGKETFGPGQGKLVRICTIPIKLILSADIQYILMFLRASSRSSKFHSLGFHLRGRRTGLCGRNKSHRRISSRQFDGLPRAFHEIKIDCCCPDRRSFWWFHRNGLYQAGSKYLIQIDHPQSHPFYILVMYWQNSKLHTLETIKGYKMEQKLKNPAFDQKTLDELFIDDSEFQELIKVESISDSNKNPIPEKLAYSVKLLRALIEILKPSKNTKGNLSFSYISYFYEIFRP